MNKSPNIIEIEETWLIYPTITAEENNFSMQKEEEKA